MKIHREVFHPSDIIKMGEIQEGKVINLKQAYLLSRYPSYTWSYGDKIILAGGYVPKWKGVGELWTAVPVTTNRRALLIALKDVQYVLLRSSILHGILRYQTDVRMDFPMAHTMLKRTGFKLESVRTMYTEDGADSAQYVWLAKDHI